MFSRSKSTQFQDIIFEFHFSVLFRHFCFTMVWTKVFIFLERILNQLHSSAESLQLRREHRQIDILFCLRSEIISDEKGLKVINYSKIATWDCEKRVQNFKSVQILRMNDQSPHAFVLSKLTYEHDPRAKNISLQKI